jgi:hypothetical protein
VAVLTECYRSALAGEPEPSIDQLEETLSLNHPSTVAATERLVTAGLLALTGPRRESFVPARESATVTVAQALKACGATCDDLPPGGNEAVERLARVLRDGERARAEKLDRVTFADLLGGDTSNF